MSRSCLNVLKLLLLFIVLLNIVRSRLLLTLTLARGASHRQVTLILFAGIHWLHLLISFSFSHMLTNYSLESMLRQIRSDLLKLYSDPSNNVETCGNLFKQYVSLLTGFLNDLSGRNSGGDSKLRFTFKSKWSQSLYPQNSL